MSIFCKKYFLSENSVIRFAQKPILVRFVLYQLSKNLNRPFFMDFLTQLSIRYTEKAAVLVDEEDPEDAGNDKWTI